MIKVYSARDGAEAHLIRGMLDGEGIRAIVQGEALGLALGHMALAADTTPTVWVVNDATGGDYYAETPKPYRRNELLPEELRLS